MAEEKLSEYRSPESKAINIPLELYEKVMEIKDELEFEKGRSFSFDGVIGYLIEHFNDENIVLRNAPKKKSIYNQNPEGNFMP